VFFLARDPHRLPLMRMVCWCISGPTVPVPQRHYGKQQLLLLFETTVSVIINCYYGTIDTIFASSRKGALLRVQLKAWRCFMVKVDFVLRRDKLMERMM